jgi:hypothetical protein
MKVLNFRDTKTYRGLKAEFHVFLTPSLDVSGQFYLALCPLVENLPTSTHGIGCVANSRSASCGVDKYLLFLSGIESQFLGRPARSLASILSTHYLSVCLSIYRPFYIPVAPTRSVGHP